MRNKIKKAVDKITQSRISGIFAFLLNAAMLFQYHLLCTGGTIRGKRKPSKEEVRAVAENVTFIFKSFERQKMARRLYYNIQRYYPGTKVIIADDSKKPLEIEDAHAEVLQLPFNTGLSYGLNRALERVKTPFVMRMDDDELLTPYSQIGQQLQFMMRCPFVGLVGILPYMPLKRQSLVDSAVACFRQNLRDAFKPLILPHMTPIDETRTVVAKAPNIFLARTAPFRAIGYDDNIRMIDHNEFFLRAAGNLVSVLDISAFVFHYHNYFDSHYQRYRGDWHGDIAYINQKHAALRKDTNVKPQESAQQANAVER